MLDIWHDSIFSIKRSQKWWFLDTWIVDDPRQYSILNCNFLQTLNLLTSREILKFKIPKFKYNPNCQSYPWPNSQSRVKYVSTWLTQHLTIPFNKRVSFSYEDDDLQIYSNPPNWCQRVARRSQRVRGNYWFACQYALIIPRVTFIQLWSRSCVLSRGTLFNLYQWIYIIHSFSQQPGTLHMQVTCLSSNFYRGSTDTFLRDIPKSHFFSKRKDTTTRVVYFTGNYSRDFLTTPREQMNYSKRRVVTTPWRQIFAIKIDRYGVVVTSKRWSEIHIYIYLVKNSQGERGGIEPGHAWGS